MAARFTKYSRGVGIILLLLYYTHALFNRIYFRRERRWQISYEQTFKCAAAAVTYTLLCFAYHTHTHTHVYVHNTFDDNGYNNNMIDNNARARLLSCVRANRNVPPRVRVSKMVAPITVRFHCRRCVFADTRDAFVLKSYARANAAL